jgi:hypothetical protein
MSSIYYAYKTIIESIAQILRSHTQPTTLHKVRAHPNIDGNEQAHALAKRGRKLDNENAITSFKHAHPTTYYLQEDWWHSMQETPDKGPIIDLDKHILKYDKTHNITVLVDQTCQSSKWLEIKDIENYATSLKNL